MVGPAQYNLYRGFFTLGNVYEYNQQCLQSNLPVTTGQDPFAPRPFTYFFYLVTSKCSVGDPESSQGVDSTGALRGQCFACPDPTKDLDVDTVEDALDNCPPDPPNPTANPSQGDLDLDSHGDICDNCEIEFNPDQADLDDDDVGDVCDPDVDGDGIPDDRGPGPCPDQVTVDCDDNCPRNPNSDQADGDHDFVGDKCDSCPEDFNPLFDCDDVPETPDEQCDSDGDGIGDVCDPE